MSVAEIQTEVNAKLDAVRATLARELPGKATAPADRSSSVVQRRCLPDVQLSG